MYSPRTKMKRVYFVNKLKYLFTLRRKKNSLKFLLTFKHLHIKSDFDVVKSRKVIFCYLHYLVNEKNEKIKNITKVLLMKKILPY